MEGQKSAAEINRRYSIALPAPRARTSPVPREWMEDVTFPDRAADREPSWQERDVFAWFDTYGAERFEPLELWHIPTLAREFQRRVGRRPRPDRSYLPPWPARVRRFAWRTARAALRTPF